MHYFTTALAFAGLLTSTLAAPTPAGNLEARAYSWQVTKWQFSLGNQAWDYSFTVTGAKRDLDPKFTAKCYGSAGEAYANCDVLESNGKPRVQAKVRFVEDEDGRFPRVFVREKTVADLCSSTSIGQHTRLGVNQPIGSGKGSNFKITEFTGNAYCE